MKITKQNNKVVRYKQSKNLSIILLSSINNSLIVEFLLKII